MGKSSVPFAAFDNFSRTRQFGWGTATSGQPWVVQPKDRDHFSVNGEFGIGVLSATTSNEGNPRVAVLSTPTSTTTQSMLFSFVPRSWDSHADFGPVLLRNSDTRYVMLRLRPGDGEGTVQLVLRDGGNYTALVPDPGSNSLPFAPGGGDYRPGVTPIVAKNGASFGNGGGLNGGNTHFHALVYKFRKQQAYWCRFEYGWGAKQLRFRIWQDGQAEPGGWQATYTQGKSFKGSDLDWIKGSQGMAIWQTSPCTVGIRTLYVYTAAAEEYGLDGMLPAVTGLAEFPLADDFGRSDFAGWGEAGTGALWYGNVLDDPSFTDHSGEGWTADGNAYLRFKQAYTKNGGLWAFTGNTDNRRKQVEARFRTNDLTSDTVLRVGPRGQMGLWNGAVSGVGYAVQIPFKASSTLRLVVKDKLKAQEWSNLTADGNDVVQRAITLKPNTDYTVRIQLRLDGDGFRLNASLWESAGSAPASFQLTYSNLTSPPMLPKGVPFLNVADSSDGGLFTLRSFAATTALAAETPVATERRFRILNAVENAKTSTSIDLTFNYDGTISDETDVTITYYDENKPHKRTVLSRFTSAQREQVTVKRTSFRATTGAISGLEPNTGYVFVAKMEEDGIPTARLTTTIRTNYEGIWIPSVTEASVSHNQFFLIAEMGTQVTAEAAKNASAVLRYRPTSVTEVVPWQTESMERVIREGRDNFEGFGRRVFYQIVDGVLPDTTYEYAIEVTDPDGVEGSSKTTTVTRTGSVTTFGRQPLVEWLNPETGLKENPIEVHAEMTTARVRIHYRWDIDDLVQFELSYREAGEDNARSLKRVYQNDRRRFRRDTSTASSKYWEARLTGLTPGVDYEIKVVVRHPHGTVDGTTRYSQRFSTRFASGPLDLRPKHYLFKVYSPEGRYLDTWHDAGEPKFSLNENGGVSDMTVKLPRQISVVGTDSAIALGNRVDVWVLDHTSDGIGRNLVLDGNFDLGAWATRSGWNVDPTGGIEDSACLSVNTKANDNVALSEFISMVNPNDDDTKYNVVISVSPIIEQFKDKLAAKSPNFKQISAALKGRLTGIFPQRLLNAEMLPQIDQITDPTFGLIRVAADKDNYTLLDSVELSFLTTNRDMVQRVQQLAETAGCLVTVDEQVGVTTVPYVLQFAAKATTGTVTAQIEYYDIVNPATGDVTSAVSEESVSTQGTNWEMLKLVFTPPMGTRHVRIRFTGQGAPVVGVVDKVQLLPQELLIYRGKVETIKTAIDEKGESIDLEVMGLVSQLTDIYIRFKQWVDVQPLKDQPKWVDQSFSEDTAPPPTLTEPTNKIKIRESATEPANRYAMVFPEITADHVIVRVYYDGDDNSNAKCTIYYTGNMGSTFKDNYFTSVAAGQVVYAIKSTTFFDESFNAQGVFGPGDEMHVLTPSDNLAGFIHVGSGSGETGYVDAADVTDTEGTTQGGLGSVAGGAVPNSTRQ